MNTAPQPTPDQLREQYARAGLEQRGISYERAMQSDPIRLTLIRGAQAAHTPTPGEFRRLASRAHPAIEHQEL